MVQRERRVDSPPLISFVVIRQPQMPLSEKAQHRLLMPFALSPIMKWGALPGIVGLILIAVGGLKKIGWLKIAGAVLAAPMFWCYFVILFIFMPYLLFEKIQRSSR